MRVKLPRLHSIRVQIILILAVLSLLPLAGFALYSTSMQYKTDEEASLNHLKTAAQVKQETLHTFQEGIRDSDKSIAINTFVRNTLLTLQQKNEDEESDKEPADYKQAVASVRNFQESSWGHLHHVMVADRNGKVVISPPHGDSTHSHLDQIITHPAFAEALRGTPQLTDFFGFSESDHFHQLDLVPVKDEDGSVLGVVISEIVISDELNKLQAGLDLGDTGSVFMVTPEGQRIVHAKADVSPPVNLSQYQTALKNGMAAGQFTNDSGLPIVGVYLHESGYPWILCVEQSQAIVFATGNRMRNLAIMAVVILFSLIIPIAVWFARRFSDPILQVVERMKRIAGGELSDSQLIIRSRDEIGQLTENVNEMQDSLRTLVSGVIESSREVASMSNEITSRNETISSGMDRQSSQTMQVASAVAEMSQSADEVAQKTDSAASGAEEVGSLAKQGGEIVDNTICAMNSVADSVSESGEVIGRLGERSQEIGKLIDMIDDIADQTNLLALNAAIEAARAGEHGRGFAVVADEVRNLAERTMKTTNEVASSIKAIQEETNNAVSQMKRGQEQTQTGVGSAQESGEALQSIVSGTVTMSEMISAIAASAHEQSQTAGLMSRSIEEITEVSQQTLDDSRETLSLSNELQAKSQQLIDLAGRFKL